MTKAWMNNMVFLMSLIVTVVIATQSVWVGNAQNCGEEANGNKCTDGSCCSKNGWCGNTPEHCKGGCQTGYGKCHGGPSHAHAPGSEASVQEEADRTPVMNMNMNITHDDSWYNDPHCGKQAKGEACDTGFCCSKDGYCGTSDDYCGAGCQAGCDNGSASGPAPTH